MSWMSRLCALMRRGKFAAEHDEELRYHLAKIEETKLAQGLPAEEARLAAKRRFGSATLLKEEMHDADVFTFLESVVRDIRFAARMLAKHPAFTTLAVLALAVGIGANTAVFTAYKAILLAPFDGKDPAQLVNIYRSTQRDQYQTEFSYPDFEFYRDNNGVLSGLIATAGDELALTGAEQLGIPQSAPAVSLFSAAGFSLPSLMQGGAEFVRTVSVSENYFAVLGVNALRGRVFLPQDANDLDAHPAVLMSENYWKRRFGGDAELLGKTIRLNGIAFSIIGVTPHDFDGTDAGIPDFWLPMRLRPLVNEGTGSLHDREDFCCSLYGRLAAGTSLLQAQGQMSLLADRLRQFHAPHSEGAKALTITLTPGSRIRPLRPMHDPGLELALFLIMAAVGLVLLIACANVASLQLGRSAARQREIGVRLSVGANRRRIIRQLLTESVLLGIVAGAASMLMAWAALRLLMNEIAASIPLEQGSMAMHVEPDAQIFAYVFALSLLAGVLFGLAPALEASRPDLSSALKDQGAKFALRLTNAGLRDLMVGTQVALCLFLLVGAGLLIRGSIRATTLHPGYETKNVVWLDVHFPPAFVYTHAKQLSEMRQLKARMGEQVGVRSVTLGIAPDGGGLRDAAVGIDGAAPGDGDSVRTLYYCYVAPNYFETLSIPLLRGRSFPETGSAAEPFAVLSQSAGEALWPGQNPLGRTFTLDARKQFHLAGDLIPDGRSYRVIGVAKETRPITLGGEDAKKAYLPLPPERADEVPLLIRSEGDPKAVIGELNKQVQSVDANLVVYYQTLDGLLTSTPPFVVSRLAALFASLIGVLGLCLACVGIYGTVSYAVVRRTREVGIRMALGAQKGDVLHLMLRESGRPVLIGLMAGLAMAVGAGQVLRALLFGMSPVDPTSFLGVAAIFLVIALLASYIPARQATLVDPMVALRCE
jgi:predicted permease